MLRRTFLLATLAACPALLPAQQFVDFTPAFVPATARAGERVVLEITCKIETGYHTYGAKETGSTPIGLTVTEKGALAMVGGPTIPDGHLDKALGLDQWLLDGTFKLKQAFDVPTGTQPGAIKVKVVVPYMVCDDSHCEPPAEQALEASLQVETGEPRKEHAIPKDGEKSGATSKPRTDTKPTPPPTKKDPPTPGKGSGPLATGESAGGEEGLWGFLLLAVWWGLFTLAMPCTYPMIPITITFFTKQASARGGSVFPLAMTYGIGIVAMFVLIGVVVGEPIITLAQHWVTQLVIGIAFVVFALSLFGVITLQPPQALLNLAGKASRRGGYGGVFLMGFFFVVTSFTCTAPFVASLLSVGASSGSLGRVALGMAVFGFTMALPFAILALMPGRLQAMPKAGEWMHVLKVTLGFIELAAALKFFSTVEMQFQAQLLPRELFLWIWAIIFGIAGVYLLGLIRMHGDSPEGVGPLRMTNGLVLVLLATYFAFGGTGSRLHWIVESIAPDYHAEYLAAAKTGNGKPEDSPGALIVKDDLDGARELATAKRRWVLVNFTGFG